MKAAYPSTNISNLLSTHITPPPPKENISEPREVENVDIIELVGKV